jgi:hypothetical protein
MIMTNRSRNLFDLLDANADSQLDLPELLAARTLSLLRDAGRSLSRAEVPLSVLVTAYRGPVEGLFGRLRLARRQAALVERRPLAGGLPRWFTAMDQNGDGRLSHLEFLGPPARFDDLDRNVDGSIDEAEVATPVSDGEPAKE